MYGLSVCHDATVNSSSYCSDKKQSRYVRSVCVVSCLPAFRDKGRWTVKIDNISKSEAVFNRTDVQLFGKRAYIGGRPGLQSLIAADCITLFFLFSLFVCGSLCARGQDFVLLVCSSNLPKQSFIVICLFDF